MTIEECISYVFLSLPFWVIADVSVTLICKALDFFKALVS